MTEISESVYFRSDDRNIGIQWLQDNELAGYVLPPRGHWVQVFPDWAHLARNGLSAKALQNSPGLLVYYYFADERLWSFCIHRNGKAWFQYECIWMVDEFVCEGVDPTEAADLFGVPASEFESLLYTGPGGASWQAMADNAAELAHLVELPNFAFASFDYAEEDATISGLSKFFVGPDTGYDAELETDDDSPGAANSRDPSPDVQPDRRGDDAPWQAVYDLARNFLQHLHDQELIELTLNSQLARDRLVERLTKTVLENPVSSDSQVLHHWLECLLTAPEIVDVFATDDMLADAYHRAKSSLE